MGRRTERFLLCENGASLNLNPQDPRTLDGSLGVGEAPPGLRQDRKRLRRTGL